MKSVVFSKKSVVFSKKSVVFSTKSIIFSIISHLAVGMAERPDRWIEVLVLAVVIAVER